MKKIFTFAKNDLTPAATPTDWVVVQGADGYLGHIKRITVSTEGSTTAGTMACNLFRRSSAGTVATLTPIVAGKHNPNSDNAQMSVGYLTANYTALGTTVSQLGAKILIDPLAGTGQSVVEWEYRWSDDEGLFLRGSSDFICINLNGDALPAGTNKFYVEIVIEETGVR